MKLTPTLSLKAITKLPPSELDVIVKDILASLPSFKPPSSRGKELLDLLLGQARAMLKSDLPSSGESGSLYNVRYYLDLASFITVENRLSAPSHLLRFYYSNLTPKLVLGRLAEDDQAYVIRRVAETFAAYDETGVRAPPTAPAADVAKQAGNGPDFADDGALRKQFIDICSVLLQVSRYHHTTLFPTINVEIRSSPIWNRRARDHGQPAILCFRALFA